VRWQDVLGMREAKMEIKYSIIQAEEQPNSMLRGSKNKGLLLYSGPRNVKTMLGKALSNRCEGTCFIITRAELKDKLIEQSAKTCKAS